MKILLQIWTGFARAVHWVVFGQFMERGDGEW